jgi:hypothetical protein
VIPTGAAAAIATRAGLAGPAAGEATVAISCGAVGRVRAVPEGTEAWARQRH